MKTILYALLNVLIVTTHAAADGACIVSGRFRVHGNLTIRGKTQPATIPITFMRLNDGAYRAAGQYKFTQTSFGIKPIQLAGGTIKVKDELQVEFELFLK